MSNDTIITFISNIILYCYVDFYYTNSILLHHFIIIIFKLDQLGRTLS